ncbi:DUF362 domain-containing protein [bacterium]|nr:DUF362 domain-containing protein [bacterium]
MKQYVNNRRDFLKTASTGVIGAGMASGLLLSVPEAYGAQEKVKIAVVHNEKAITARNECDPKQSALMIENALLTLTGKQKPAEAWAALGVTKDDVVGIKVNCNAAGFNLYAHPELVYALCDSLSAVVRPNNIIIYERYTGELTRSGYRENKGTTGVRCFGADQGGGFHPKEGLTRIITDTCTKLINVPTLKAFGGEFVGSLCLKNHIGSLPPGEMSRCHGNTDFLNNVSSQPSIKNKTVLALCDGLRGTYRRSDPWYWGGIIASSDPVAVEYTALQIVNEKLKVEKASPNALPSYVKMAETTYQLGTCDPAKMDVQRTEM